MPYLSDIANSILLQYVERSQTIMQYNETIYFEKTSDPEISWKRLKGRKLQTAKGYYVNSTLFAMHGWE